MKINLLLSAFCMFAFFGLNAQADEVVEISEDTLLVSVEAQEFFNQGVLMFNQQQYEEALSFYNKAIEISPVFEAAYKNRAYLFIKLKEVDNAQTDFEYLLTFAEKLDDVYFELGIIMEQKGNTEKAIEYFALAQKSAPNNAEYAYVLGLQHFKNNDFDLAIEAYSAAIKIEEIATAYNDRGSCYFSLGEIKLAISDYEKATKKDPNLALAFDNLGVAYALNQQFSEALFAHQMATNLEVNNHVFLNNRGYAFYLNADYEKAIKDFDAVLKIEPNYIFAINNMAAAYVKMEKFEKVIELTTKAIQIDEDFGQAYCNRGIAFEMLRKDKEACEDWIKASDLGVELAEKYVQMTGCTNIYND